MRHCGYALYFCRTKICSYSVSYDSPLVRPRQRNLLYFFKILRACFAPQAMLCKKLYGASTSCEATRSKLCATAAHMIRPWCNNRSRNEQTLLHLFVSQCSFRALSLRSFMRIIAQRSFAEQTSGEFPLQRRCDDSAT